MFAFVLLGLGHGRYPSFLETLERSIADEIYDLQRSIDIDSAPYERLSRTDNNNMFQNMGWPAGGNNGGNNNPAPPTPYPTRRRPKGATHTVDSQSRVVPGCDMLSGFSIDTRRCGVGKAIFGIEMCKKGRTLSETCIAEDFTAQASGWKEYNEKVERTEELTKLIDSSVKAEGAGYGLSVSASASFMMDEASTANSVMFFIGKYGDVYKKKIQGRHGLKLHDAAITLLGQDYQMFIETYGSHYISEIIYGTSFIGMAKVTAKSQDSKSELKTAADLSYKSFAKGDASFKAATTGKSSSLDVTVKSTYVGTTGDADASSTKGTYDSKDAVKELMDDYRAWDSRTKGTDDARRKQSTAMKMTYRTWLDITQVMETLQANYKGDKFKDALNAFKTAMPGSTVTNMIATDVIYASTQLNNLRLYKGYRCAKRDNQIMDIIEKGIDTLTQYRAQYDMISNEEILELQAEIANGENEKVDKFFIGRNTELTKKVADLLQKCPPQCPKKDNVRYYGDDDDYKVIWYINDPAECANRCGEDSGCQSWTMDRNTQHCWLIANSHPNEGKDDGFISGPKCTDSSVKMNNRPSRCVSKANTIIWWNDLWWNNHSGVGSMAKCAEMCRDNKECKAWEWHDDRFWHEKKHCRLKDEIENKKDYEGGKKGSFAGTPCVAKINTQHVERRLDEDEVSGKNTALVTMERLAALQGPQPSHM